MHIDLNDIPPGFIKKVKDFCGEQLTLVYPGVGATYNKDNLIFRSSIWNAQGEPVSLSFKKFFNAEEHQELYPCPPEDVREFSLLEKLDGSTLIVSKYRGNLLLRTRGSFDARAQPNGDELCPFEFKLSHLESGDTWQHSYVFEWYSPVNRIILNYGDTPLLWLTCVIRHQDYSYWSQPEIDALAKQHGFARPKHYTFSSVSEFIPSRQENPAL